LTTRHLERRDHDARSTSNRAVEEDRRHRHRHHRRSRSHSRERESHHRRRRSRSRSVDRYRRYHDNDRRPPPPPPKRNGISDEDRQRRLREMMQNATDVEHERRGRLDRAAEDDARQLRHDEAKREENHRLSMKSTALRQMEYQAYASSNSMDLADRLRRQRPNLARVRDE